MNRAPPRPSSNRYSCLPVEECHEDCIPTTAPAAPPIKSPEAASDALPTVPLAPQFEFVEIPRGKKRSKTERRLPHRLTIAYTSTLSTSLMLKVELESTTDATTVSTEVLGDTGASSMGYLDSAFVAKSRLPTRRLLRPIPVYNVDGTLNEAGSVTHVAEVVVRYKGHSERAQFAVTRLGRHNMILGIGWFRLHNPEIDWATGEVKMTRCPPQCATCREEAALQRRRLRSARAGPFPCVMELHKDEDDSPRSERRKTWRNRRRTRRSSSTS